MPGALDPQSGTYVYASDDARSPMHTVLNLLASSVRVALIAAKQRLTDLEQRFADIDIATPWTAPTAGSGFTLSGLTSGKSTLAYRREGNQVFLTGTIKRTGGAWPNWTVAATIPAAYRPNRIIEGLYFVGNGPGVARTYASPDGTLTVPVAGGATNDELTFLEMRWFLS